jgi:hypothetical protein
MTIIAFKDGVMAADTARFSGNGRYIVGHVQKLRRLKSGGVFGACGPAPSIEKAYAALNEWAPGAVLNPLDKASDEDVSGIVALPDGSVWHFWWDMKPLKCPDHYAVDGYGDEIAIGALEAGATAEQAVSICIRRSAGCGGSVTSMPVQSLYSDRAYPQSFINASTYNA